MRSRRGNVSRSDGSFIERAGRSLPNGDNAEAEFHEVSAAAARIWVKASRAAGPTAIHFRNGGGLLIRPAWCSSHRILARSALVWMEDALETRTITAPNRCHRSRLDHRVCGRPARNRVLVRCSPDRSRTVDHHPTITVNPILPISRSPDRISSTPHAPRPREAKRPCESGHHADIGQGGYSALAR